MSRQLYEFRPDPPAALTSRAWAADFNEITLDDKKGSEQLFLHAQKDMKTEVENDQTLTVENDRTVTINKGNETVTLKQGDQTTELKLGDSASLSRTFTRDEVQTFALASGDVNPAHGDPEYSTSSMFQAVIAHAR